MRSWITYNNLSLSTSRQNQLTNICNTVSNLESDLISFKEEIQTKLDTMHNLQLLNEKLESAQLKHQNEISLLSRKVYDLQLENMNLKADLTKLLSSDKKQYRQMGKIESSINKLNAAIYVNETLPAKIPTQQERIKDTVSSDPAIKTFNYYQPLTDQPPTAVLPQQSKDFHIFVLMLKSLLFKTPSYFTSKSNLTCAAICRGGPSEDST